MLGYSDEQTLYDIFNGEKYHYLKECHENNDFDKFKNDKEKEKAKVTKRKLSEQMIRSGIILSEISKDNQKKS